MGRGGVPVGATDRSALASRLGHSPWPNAGSAFLHEYVLAMFPRDSPFEDRDHALRHPTLPAPTSKIRKWARKKILFFHTRTEVVERQVNHRIFEEKRARHRE
jgi:hypothetical protein